MVVGRDDAAAALSFRNLPEVQLIAPAELNAYDVLCNDWIVFTQDVLPTFSGTAKVAADAGASGATDAATVPAAFADLGEVESGREAATGSAVSPYGAGSHIALRDDAQPEGFPIKGNASSNSTTCRGPPSTAARSPRSGSPPRPTPRRPASPGPNRSRVTTTLTPVRRRPTPSASSPMGPART